MEARQGVQLTGTNRPSGLASTFHVDVCVHCAVPEIRSAPCRSRTLGRVRPAHLHSVSAAIAKGKHPVPFRTRKLSPSAPMVLRGGPRGRVGRRRTSPVEAAPGTGAASTALPHRYPHPQHPRNEIPTGERAPDRPFRCEGTPHGRDHPASTAASSSTPGDVPACQVRDPGTMPRLRASGPFSGGAA